MFLDVMEVSKFTHTELMGLDVFDFMIYYNTLVQKAKKKNNGR
jgi:hypothetical protein